MKFHLLLSIHTLAAGVGHFCKGIITSVALSPNNTRLAWALASLRITGSGTSAREKAVTGVTGVAVFGLVVVVL